MKDPLNTPDSKRTLILFRHGETPWNYAGRIQGHLDVPLNARGRAQAKRLKPHLARLKIEAILTSDLCRAWETAELASPGPHIPIRYDPRLRETFLGPLQGLTKEELHHHYPESRAALGEGPPFPYLSDEAVQGLGAELPSSVLARAREAIEEDLHRRPVRILGISSHGGVIRRLLQHALQSKVLPPPVPNAALYPIEVDLLSHEWRMIPVMELARS